jgi:hypothetical protein
VRLELSEEGADAPHELLASSLVELNDEIHDTDGAAFCRGRTQTRETLETLTSRRRG